MSRDGAADLPAPDAGPTAEEGYVAATGRGLSDGPTVLLIDPDADTRSMLRMLFERRGYRVFESRNASEGVAMARRFRPRAVISEYRIPPRRGRCVPEELARAGVEPEVRVVWTADALPEVSEAVESLGCVHLLKPLQPTEVLEEVHSRLTG